MQRDALLLDEMIDAADQAVTLARASSVEQLQTDRVRRDALLWNLTVLGEASAQLSSELKQRHVQVPWQRPTELRNRIVHGYWSIDLTIIHTTATDQLPEFLDALRRVARTEFPDR